MHISYGYSHCWCCTGPEVDVASNMEDIDDYEVYKVELPNYA